MDGPGACGARACCFAGMIHERHPPDPQALLRVLSFLYWRPGGQFALRLGITKQIKIRMQANRSKVSPEGSRCNAVSSSLADGSMSFGPDLTSEACRKSSSPRKCFTFRRPVVPLRAKIRTSWSMMIGYGSRRTLSREFGRYLQEASQPRSAAWLDKLQTHQQTCKTAIQLPCAEMVTKRERARALSKGHAGFLIVLGGSLNPRVATHKQTLP